MQQLNRRQDTSEMQHIVYDRPESAYGFFILCVSRRGASQHYGPAAAP
jgi:hypothetical protein